MNVLIDNKDLATTFGITVLDWTAALGFAAEREDTQVWYDKSGDDPNLENVRYEAKEFLLSCIVEADNEVDAYDMVKTLIEYMLSKGVFVLSLRNSTQGVRESFICTRSGTISPNINIRQQNSLYVFKLGLKDINPNAVRFPTEIIGGSVTVSYTKGIAGNLYWGDGSRIEVSNSGDYTKSDYAADGPVDVFIDVDKDNPDITDLICDFSGTPLAGDVEVAVQFTDESIGDPVIWSWDFGDGSSSSLQNPSHKYTAAGTYTVTLQVFNAASGSSTKVRAGYITATIPDFDSNIDPLELSAIVSKPFTFTLQADTTNSTFLAQAVNVALSLNGVIDTFSIAAGTDLSTVSIVKSYPNIAAESYFKVTTTFTNGTKINPSGVFQKGSLIMQNAGMSRIRMYADLPPNVRPWNMLLSGNNIIEDDINSLLETYAYTESVGKPQGAIDFDISGGTSAIPTSVAAIAVKVELVNDPYQSYSDNA